MGESITAQKHFAMATHHKLLNIHVEGRVRLGNLDLDLDF